MESSSKSQAFQAETGKSPKIKRARHVNETQMPLKRRFFTLIFYLHTDRWFWPWYQRRSLTTRNTHSVMCNLYYQYLSFNRYAQSYHFCLFDLDLGTIEKILPQEIHMWNMKAISLTIKKLWLMLKYLHRQENRGTDRAKTICPWSINIRHKKSSLKHGKKRAWSNV